MFFLRAIPTLMLTLALGGVVSAQDEHGHAGDVELGYNNPANPTAITFEVGEVTTDGIAVFESELEEEDPTNDPGNFSSEEPGFEAVAAEGLVINQGDNVFLEVLNASNASLFGVGYVNFYDPTTDQLTAAGEFSVSDAIPSTEDLILNGAALVSGDNPQFLETADELNEIHSHLEFDLLNDATALMGAYGILMRFQSDLNPVAGNVSLDIASDPFWVVWNHGLSEEDFETRALARFGVSAVPEPGAASLLLVGSLLPAFHRRRAIRMA